MSNDKTESISARLRRWADESDTYENPPHCIASKELCIDCPNIPCLKCENKLFNRIADEIDSEMDELREDFTRRARQDVVDALRDVAMGKDGYESLSEIVDRYFLPRPLFEDGEPVQFGDEIELHYRDGGVDKGRIQEIKYNRGPVWILLFTGVDHAREYRYDSECDVIKRSVPKVLDADGVPIETGDKVWLVPGEHCDVYPLNGYGAGVEYRVNENNNPNHKPNGRICISGGDCIYGYPMPEQVTHREPDSLKKLLNDIRGYLAESPCIDVHVRPWERRLTALIELDGRDARWFRICH